MVEKDTIQNLQDISNVLRIDSLKMTDASASGHPTSCASMAELISVLFFHNSGMHFNPKDPKNPANDIFVLSKGHASPIYYSAWAHAGTFPVDDLMNLRKITSDLEGHPTPRLSFVDFGTGSLGQGLANTVGCAYSSKYFDNNPNKYYCLMGDGETMEGSVWEAAHFAGLYKLDNVVGIVDCNRLGQSDITSLGHDVEVFASRFTSFGFHTIVIDGHNIEEIIKAYTEAKYTKGKPTMIVAKTLKGKGFEGAEDLLNFHGKPMKSTKMIETIEGRIVNKSPNFNVTLPTNTFNYTNKSYEKQYKLTLDYPEGKKFSSREGFGMALKKLGQIDGKGNNIVIGVDGDVKNSTFTEPLYKEFPDKFLNCYIAEQLLVSASSGLSKRNKIPFCATFSTFYTRAFDQIRMGAISQDNIKFVGTHSGCHIGEDGPSQMGLEDIGLFRSVPGMTVLLPSDVVSAERSIELAANHKGSVYVRTERNAHDTLYSKDEVFEIGKCKVLKTSDSDVITVVSHGAALHEVISAYETLKKEGVNIRVIDLFSCKPIDIIGLFSNISQTNNTALVVEDHYYEGGAGDAVISTLGKYGLKIYHHAVDKVPRSGKPEELFDLFGLSAKHIVGYVKRIVPK